MSFNWICPYCNSKTTIIKNNFQANEIRMLIENSDGNKLLRIEWIICPNEECKKISLDVILYSCVLNQFETPIKGEQLKFWKLLPGSYAKAFPDYIPKSLIIDYQEASSIIDLSPKASATLARRCIQGIIRDFWGIKKSRLIDEINALENKIDPLTWKSIDSIRKIGNIGAHMEKNINLIINVEPNEAKMLINLIELLFEEWYIHKYERELKLKKIVSFANDKESLKNKPKAVNKK